MAQYKGRKKKQEGTDVSSNILNDPEERKKLKSALATVTHIFQLIDDHKESIKETVEGISQQYNLDKKLVRKLASTMYKRNYQTLQDENKHFEILYETLIEGKLRDDVNDPLDKILDDEDDGDGDDTA